MIKTNGWITIASKDVTWEEIKEDAKRTVRRWDLPEYLEEAKKHYDAGNLEKIFSVIVD